MLPGSAQRSGGGDPSGRGGAIAITGGSSRPPMSKRTYLGSKLNRDLQDRDASVEREGKTAPSYPKYLRWAGVEGTVVLEVRPHQCRAKSTGD